jgi:hypothetical protein
MLVHENFDGSPVSHNRKILSQDSRARQARKVRHSESGLASRACLARRARRVLESLPDFS